MADWTEITVRVPAADTDKATDIANMTVPYGVYVEDYRDLEIGAREIAHIDLIDEALLQKDRTHTLVHVYISPEESPQEAIAYLRERLTAEAVEHEVLTASVSEEDWANNWKQYFKPLAIGERLLVVPTWENAEASGRTILRIDPGMAFGTGGHDTTRLVLTAMEEVITPDTTILDVGCGSGILSIAGCLLGARGAYGVDIDPLAVKTAAENAALNGLPAAVCAFAEGDLVKKVTGQYDLVVANIVADAIIMLTPAVMPHIRPDGTYIVSGIIDTREAEVVTALENAGLTVQKRLFSKGWVCLVTKNAM